MRDVAIAAAIVLALLVVGGLGAVGAVLGAARLEKRRELRAARELVGGGLWDVEDAREGDWH